MKNICVTYRRDGIEQSYEVSPERLDELLARADARFLPPWTKADERRFDAILKADGKRRGAILGC